MTEGKDFKDNNPNINNEKGDTQMPRVRGHYKRVNKGFFSIRRVRVRYSVKRLKKIKRF
ncbi:MAG TPA: hypothetical protein VJ438_06040 [Candidatus Nanoarchaeia archaeon]|nr:hypothetical protein [Candidatus Nanoarchaeia archaeon]